MCSIGRSAIQVVDARQTRPSPRFTERVWLRQTSLRHDTVVCKWLFQSTSTPMVRVRRIIEFHIMLRTPAKLLLLGSYDLAYTVSR